MNGMELHCGCGKAMRLDRRVYVKGVDLYRCPVCGWACQIITDRMGCGVRVARGTTCPAPAYVTEPVRLCEEHLLRMLTDERVVSTATVRAAMLRLEDHYKKLAEGQREAWQERDDQRAAKLRENAVVYYIRRDTRIKIGTTGDLHQRMLDLQPDAILATEPGGRDIEKKRHKQFAHLRIRGEWFTPAVDLLEHIAAVCAEHGEP